MDEQRMGEIALAVAKYNAKRTKQGLGNDYFCPGTDFVAEFTRMFEDAARETNVPKQELMEWSIAIVGKPE